MKKGAHADANSTADSPELRLELTDDDESIVYCVECWNREFAEG
jgi:hypothetical protein